MVMNYLTGKIQCCFLNCYTFFEKETLILMFNCGCWMGSSAEVL